MADPFSIIGLIATVASALTVLRDAFEAMRDAPGFLKDILDRTAGFELLLKRLKLLENALSEDRKQFLTAYFDVEQCRASVTNLTTLVSKLTPDDATSRTQDLKRRLHFVVKKDEALELLEELNTQQNDIARAISLIASESTLNTESKVLEAITASQPITPFHPPAPAPAAPPPYSSTALSPQVEDLTPHRLVWLSPTHSDPPLSDHYVLDRQRLSDAAHHGHWDDLISNLEIARHRYKQNWVNVCRLIPRDNTEKQASGFTPLHQAAFMGAPLQIVQQLLSMGASRTLLALRPRFHDMTPLDLAHEGGWSHLYDVLAPVIHHTIPYLTLEALQTRLHDLIKEKCPHFIHSPHRHRLPQLSPLTEFKEMEMLMPTDFHDTTLTTRICAWEGSAVRSPSMYEVGFEFQLDDRELLVMRTDRGGSIQTYRLSKTETREICDAVIVHR